MRKRICALICILFIILPVGALAAPTSGQIDFVSRHKQGGYVVEQGGYVFYVHKGAIYRMTPDGKNKEKQYTMNAPFDLQNGGMVYFIDGKDSALYRFRPGDKSPARVARDVYDAIIGGDILYYVNKTGDAMYAWNLRTGAKSRMYNGQFKNARNLNYMQNLLTFTATIGGKESLFVYSPVKNHATYYPGMSSATLAAQGSYIYMSYKNNLVRVKWSDALPSIALGATMKPGVKDFFIAGTNFYYVKTNGFTVQYIKRGTSANSPESAYWQYNTRDISGVTLQPTAAAIWVFAEGRNGVYYHRRLPR